MPNCKPVLQALVELIDYFMLAAAIFAVATGVVLALHRGSSFIIHGALALAMITISFIGLISFSSAGKGTGLMALFFRNKPVIRIIYAVLLLSYVALIYVNV